MNDEKQLFDNELRYLRGGDLDPSNRTKYEPWHTVLQGKFTIHPTVKLMIERHRPKDVRQLALEYPHVSEKDATRLAYTRTAADGANDRQLVTSIGKYLSRHWPETKDDVRRDAQATYSPDTLVIRNTTPEIIQGIEDGPRSCMASVYGSIPFTPEDANQMRAWFLNITNEAPDWSKHPYSGYRPEYGWSIALRITPAGKIDGRALIYKDDDALVFLRTYRRHPTDAGGWSETDFTLQEWLKYQGYKMVDRWPEGAKIHTPSKEHGRIFAPYIDGERKGVTFDDQETSTIAYGVDYTHWCEETSGTVSSGRNSDDDDDVYESCDDCGSRQSPGDMYWTGRGEDNHVCESCITGYTWVRGESSVSSFREYYVPDDDAASVENEDYSVDKDNLPDDVVKLEDGDFAERDDCVSIDDDYYLEDDYRVVYLEDNDDLDDSYGLKSDCHEVDGKFWYDEAHYLEFHPRDSEGDEVESLTAIES